MVTWDNAIHLSNEAGGASTFTRHRTNVMGQWFPNNQVEFGLKVTNEFRNYFAPQGKDYKNSEIFVDLLYAKWQNDKVLPGTMTLGRQNIILGEGFVVMDGHPLDGSRSIYFNAARYDWTISKNKKLTLFYTYQPVTDESLVLAHDLEDQVLIEQPEEGIGAYFTGDMGKVNLQSYVIQKNIKETDARPEKSHITTLGSRLSLPLMPRLSITGEAAYQFGDKGDGDRAALGSYLHLDYKTSWTALYLPKLLKLGSIYLSGDDPSTDDYEGWDPLFSRWPKWSESYIYTQIRENGGKVAYWSNIISINGAAQFVFTPDLSFQLDYHHLMAPQDPNGSTFPGGSGNTRGDLVIGKLNYKINKYISGHFLWEHFIPGDFYFDGADGYNWARIEFMFKL